MKASVRRARALVLASGVLVGSLAPGVAMAVALASRSGAATPCTNSEVLIAHADGSVTVEGTPGTGCATATFYGSMAGHHLNAPIVGMAATPSGKGYWLVAGDGGIFTFGDAQFHGSTGSIHLNQPIVGMAATPSGNGYWLVAADGGIFAFGDAQFYGSTGSIHLNKPVVGMAADGATGGYWLVASDGGIFAFDAPFLGSMGGKALNAPIHFVTGTPDFGGYRLVGSDGGVFDFGDAQYYGSAAAPGSTGWDALAATPDGGGYWLFATPGSGSAVTVDAFGDAGTALSPVAGDTSGAPIVGASSVNLAVAPVVTVQPSSETVDAGSTATFTAAAEGSPAPSLQWQASGGGATPFVPLQGYTSTTLSFPAVQAENGWQFRAVFTNSAGTVTTAAAVLTVIPSSAGGFFDRMSCGTPADCVVVGGTHGGTALVERSTNGGTSFTTSPVPSGVPPLADVDCNDALHCVAVGSSTVLVSDDGGATWTASSVPVPAGGGGVTITASLSGVACGSDPVCTAVGTEILSGPIVEQFGFFAHSTDGGKTWSSTSGSDIPTTVTCAGSVCNAGGEATFHSTNGGAAWTPEADGGEFPGIGCTTDLSACLAVGENPTDPTGGGLSISTDEGQSWTPGTANLPPSTWSLDTISCGGTTDCMAVGLPGTAGAALVVVTTSDSGTTWTAHAGPSGFVEPSAGLAQFESIVWPGTTCTSVTTCMVSGATSLGPIIAVTTDGGATWSDATFQ